MKKTNDKVIRRKVADKTRDTIIKSARKLFAQHGFSGTTTLAIAKAAKVNETLIFHHFKNKATLWRKVKASVVEQVQPLNITPHSLREFLEEVFYQRLAVFNHNPDLMRILQWQAMEKKQRSLIAGNAFAPTNWHEPLLHLQKLGKIDGRIDISFIVLWLSASINSVFLDSMNYFDSESERLKYVDFLMDKFELVLQG